MLAVRALVTASILTILSAITVKASPDDTINPLDTFTSQVDRAEYFSNIHKFLDVRLFGWIKVYLQSDTATGLNNSKLTDYAKLRFRNNFGNYKLDEVLVSKSPAKYSKDEKMGSMGGISFNVWTVGTDFPIAYHISIKCDVAGLSDPNKNYFDAHTAAILGYASKETIEKQVKEVIDQLMEEFAVKFLKAKGEL